MSSETCKLHTADSKLTVFYHLVIKQIASMRAELTEVTIIGHVTNQLMQDQHLIVLYIL